MSNTQASEHLKQNIQRPKFEYRKESQHVHINFSELTKFVRNPPARV